MKASSKSILQQFQLGWFYSQHTQVAVSPQEIKQIHFYKFGLAGNYKRNIGNIFVDGNNERSDDNV